MLIQLVANHPEALVTIVKNTPTWVFGLFAALAALGLSQVRTRDVSAVRMAIMPVAMSGLSLWGTISAFSASPMFGYVLLAWAAGAALMFGLLAPLAPQAGASYNSTTRTFNVPGSLVPMVLIMGIFLTKYIVGVELAMQPGLAHDGQYTLVVGGLYGVFSGTFAGRAARLWRLALRPAGAASTAAFNA
ncbi:MAG: hypothetical protein HYX47_04770 [Burkholderiales bacterium]|nr:hypothetical protein [Burkholderiales bacterium]